MDLPESKHVENVANADDLVSLATELARLNKISHLGKNDELRPNGAWLTTLVNRVADYIFVKDRHSRFVMANRQIALDIGCEASSDLIGKTDLDLHSQSIGNAFLSAEDEIMSSQEAKYDFEELLILPNGRRKWFSSSKFPVIDGEGATVGIVGICRDITARKNAELLQQGQNQVLQKIATGAPLSDVLDTLVLAIESQTEGIVGSVMLLDESSQHLLSSAGPSLPKAYLEAANGVPIGPKAGSCGTAAFRQECVIVKDILNDPLWEDFIEIVSQFDMRSCWSMPFFGQDTKLLGTFGLYSNEVRAPSDYEQNLAREAARLASIAVERDKAESRIRYLANHDVLTGLPNRHEFKAKLEQKIATCHESGGPVAVVFVDLDNFKIVNDSFGHAIGDQVLMIVAERIMSLHGHEHEAIRFGGDEFVLILDRDAAQKGELASFMSRLRDEIIKTIRIGDLSFHITCSIGAACYPEDAADAAELLRNADKAMFEAKSSGRDGFKVFEQTRPEKSLNRLTLLEEMRTGIENGEFFLEYQPQYNLESGRIVGAEALVRWQHTALGRLMPAEFITLAEDSGLIVPLGRWVMHEACRQNKEWQDKGLAPISVGVNVSARQFRETGLISDVSAVLADTGLPAQFLELELTESLLIQNAEQAVQLMESFRHIGLNLAIDDFGTGYSSLASLKSFPLTRLKIDQSFIRDLDFDESDRSIARAIISLGRELGLCVVAEGVETAKQQAFLASCRCEIVQGYHFGRPMRADKLGKLLAMTLVSLDARSGR
ncbi:EAL domain-containing protein [uncultured Roseibium sp.]|uniref:sensor domain-containing protein n=1 Tax=uncultured Roseibium sp. TaxID=1936171 RepID=UPI0026200E5B|nr:EAL domain-containing protein [uncultured Roseibium sp.]